MASIFHFVYPAVVVLIGVVFLHKPLNRGTLLAVILCVCGIGLFYEPGQSLDWTGCALALTSGVTYAIYVTLLGSFRYQEIAGYRMVFYMSLVCSAAMLVICAAGNLLTLPQSAMGWVMCALLALLVSVLATLLFQRGTFLIGGERAAVLSTVEPLTGVVIGILVFHETVTPGMGIGSALVLSACILIPLFDAEKKKSSAANRP